MTFLDTWDAVPPMWKVILKKNLIFQTELMAIQRSQSKFAARYYDMDTYWRRLFGGREIDLDITKDEFEQIQRLEKINCDGTQVEDLAILRDLGLDALKTIDCSRTAIGRIDELAGLERLAILAFEYASFRTSCRCTTRARSENCISLILRCPTSECWSDCPCSRISTSTQPRFQTCPRSKAVQILRRWS